MESQLFSENYGKASFCFDTVGGGGGGGVLCITGKFSWTLKEEYTEHKLEGKTWKS